MHLTFSERYWRWVHNRYIVTRIAGTPISLLYSSQEDREKCVERLQTAFALVQQHSPRSARCLQHLELGVLVFGAHGPQGVFYSGVGLVKLNERFILAAATSPVAIASVLVHEITHAWLRSLGFSYLEAARARIERICLRAEIAFACRAPGGTQLLPQLALQLARPDADWTDVAMAARLRDEALAFGLPKWVVSVLVWIRRRRAV